MKQIVSLSDSDFDLFSEFRMGNFDSARGQGYDFVDEDAGGIGERFPADRGAIYITDNSFIKEQGGGRK